MFKVGDRVVITEDEPNCAPVKAGQLCTVKDSSETGSYDVMPDDNGEFGEMTWIINPKYLRLAAAQEDSVTDLRLKVQELEQKLAYTEAEYQLIKKALTVACEAGKQSEAHLERERGIWHDLHNGMNELIAKEREKSKVLEDACNEWAMGDSAGYEYLIHNAIAKVRSMKGK
jgi:hypothetical protein